jgi:hypothetical protein
MYDSVTPTAIPSDAEVVAGYVDGLYRWSQSDWDRFPTAVKVTIAVFANDDADVLDVETGDATPQQAPDWIRRQIVRGVSVPTIYCNMSVIDQVRAACVGLPFNWWAAHYTYVEHLEPGSVATQWTDHGPQGRNVDISLCATQWPS